MKYKAILYIYQKFRGVDQSRPVSSRMMTVLKTVTSDVEVYSIDEAFLDLTKLGIRDFNAFSKKIYNTVYKCIGIPITVGIAPTKTLAKVANRIAKKKKSTHMVLQQCDVEEALAHTLVSDV